MRMMKRAIGLSALILAACASAPPSPAERTSNADQLASPRGWHQTQIDAETFSLTAYLPAHIDPADQLTIYIEGDGFAWISSEQPSADPTPIRPVGLQLALAQPAGNVAYLGRPCQYGGADRPPCARKYWTTHRFAPEVIAASDRAVDALKKRFGAQRLTLVGYSGGGAVAALVAAQRRDVTRLITVAGNLDHRTWTSQLHLSPLNGSLNPADFQAALGAIPQWHFVGGNDRVMPSSIAEAYSRGFSSTQKPITRVIPGYDHQCCWVQNWPAFWAEIPKEKMPSQPLWINAN